MNLYLIRHATAEDYSISKSDFDRELTHEGRKKMEAAAKGWLSFIDEPDAFVSSPLVRAVQTAEIVKKVYGSEKEIFLDKRLAAGRSRTDRIIEIAEEYQVENIAMFGHEPDFSEHVSNLISSSGAMVNFRKGAIAKISFRGKARISGGVLEFFIPVKVFL